MKHHPTPWRLCVKHVPERRYTKTYRSGPFPHNVTQPPVEIPFCEPAYTKTWIEDASGEVVIGLKDGENLLPYEEDLAEIVEAVNKFNQH